MRNFRKVMTYFVIILIALIAAVNYEIFVFPNKFAPAGLNGLCTMVQHIAGISVGFLSLIINIPLAIWTMFKVGRSLASRSMLYVAAFSIFLIVLEQLDLSAFAYETANGTSKILGPLVAGLINGVVYAMLVRTSASSGGADFIAAIIHKDRPDLNFFIIVFTINVFVAGASYFVFDYQIEPVILCIMYSFMSTMVSDKMMRSGRSAVRCEIITDYPHEISADIISKLHHSATLLPAKGMYSGRETNILVCIVNKTQLAALSAIIKDYPHTFAVMSSVNEVFGNFKRMDNRGKLEREILDKGDGQTV
jgi:uncharacterized membrane-anchored protein YitT (DUF2179 family)